MAIIAAIVDGKWVPLPAEPVQPQRQRMTALNNIDAIVMHLSEVVKLAQDLSTTDRRRARDFVHAASAVLSATTYLPDDDQSKFDRALRGGER